MKVPKLNPSAILNRETKNCSLKIKKRDIRFNKDDKLLIKLCGDIYSEYLRSNRKSYSFDQVIKKCKL